MTWFALRSQRLQLLVLVAALVVFAVWLVVTGVIDHAALVANNRCGDVGPVCNAVLNRYIRADKWTGANLGILYGVPCVLGVVLGAPLVAREIEQGTNRFAWAQGITRSHWLATKLAVGGLVVAAITGALVPLATWWTGAVQTGPQVFPKTFDVVGPVPVAFGLFAFTLGAAIGAVVRRTGWAAVASAPLFAVARIVVRTNLWHLVPSLTWAAANGTGNFGGDLPSRVANGWAVEQGLVPMGRLTPGPGQNWESGFAAVNDCFNSWLAGHGNPSVAQSEAVQARCALADKLHFVVQYQPAAHFWALQGVEVGIFATSSLLLIGLSVLAVRRWRT
jgi:hypothetical protein